MPFLAPASRQLPSKLSCSVQYPPSRPSGNAGSFHICYTRPDFPGPVTLFLAQTAVLVYDSARPTPVLNIVKGERREGAPVSSFPRTTFHPELCPGDALNVV